MIHANPLRNGQITNNQAVLLPVKAIPWCMVSMFGSLHDSDKKTVY